MNIDEKIREISRGEPVYILVLSRIIAIPLMLLLLWMTVTSFLGTREVVAEVSRRSKCASFKYQEDAQVAYWKGATWLDGNDRDQKACEHLPRLTD